MTEQGMNIDEIKRQCVFCHIVSGRVPAKKVYEDDKVTAVLDINPANPGHILILPKEHYAIMPQIPDDDIGHTGMISKALSAAVLRALKSHGTTIFIANGVAAGQRAQHFMAHVIPRTEGDSLGIELPERKITQEKLTEIRNLLLPSIKNVLGSAADTTPLADSEKKEAPKKDNKKEEHKEDKKQEPTTKNKSDTTDLDDIARLLGS